MTTLRYILPPRVNGFPVDYMPAEAGGIWKSGNVCEAVAQRHPELSRNIVECQSFVQNGTDVSDPRTEFMLWIAFFLVASRTSRAELNASGLASYVQLKSSSVPN